MDTHLFPEAGLAADDEIPHAQLADARRRTLEATPRPMTATPILLLALALVAVPALNLLIRKGLAAPRVIEAAQPDGLPWQAVRIPGAGGKSLFGWFIPAGARAPALAVLHGWGGNAEMMLPLARPLHEAGFALLLFDARCHGRSDGDTFASLPRFAEDLASAVGWLRLRPEVDAGRIGVIGHSVGAGAALLMAAHDAAVAGVVSLAAFAHPATVMRRWLRSMHLPHYPLGAYILWYVQRTIGRRFDDIAPSHTIGLIRCPVLLVHGTDDQVVPADDARAIHARRRDDRTRLLLLPGGHDDSGQLEGAMGEIIDFLNRALTPVSLHPDVVPANGHPDTLTLSTREFTPNE
ncbi:alpha/beta hydrolase [Zoogloea sp.]|uniref:alpha/beta hydrolase n=1 Tax=Zoogloea sp. TaxID=49181 RepID=UPI0035B0A0A1